MRSMSARSCSVPQCRLTSCRPRSPHAASSTWRRLRSSKLPRVDDRPVMTISTSGMDDCRRNCLNGETTMTLRLVVTAALFLLPAVAEARTPEVCQALKLRLATLPRVIGSTQEVRRNAEELRYQNDEIRHLRKIGRAHV